MVSKPEVKQAFARTIAQLTTFLFQGHLTEIQEQARQKGGSGKLYCCFADFKKAFDTVPRALLWQVLEDLGVQGGFWTSSSLCMHTTALQYSHQKDFLRSSDVLWESSKDVP